MFMFMSVSSTGTIFYPYMFHVISSSTWTNITCRISTYLSHDSSKRMKKMISDQSVQHTHFNNKKAKETHSERKRSKGHLNWQNTEGFTKERAVDGWTVCYFHMTDDVYVVDLVYAMFIFFPQQFCFSSPSEDFLLSLLRSVNVVIIDRKLFWSIPTFTVEKHHCPNNTNSFWS